MTIVYDGTSVYLYANSELQCNSSRNLNTGNKITIKLGSSNGNYITGLIDELRISTAVRSAAWIQTEYQNQNDPNNFYTISTQQTDNNSPSITDFGAESNHEEHLTFFITANDDFSSVENIIIAINGSFFNMAKNGSDIWVY
ncbi:MAG: LamG-like jellyroll fold domain-containing protein [Candidatus Hodarchaeota archaeon]